MRWSRRPTAARRNECYGVYEPFLPNLDAYAALTGGDAEAGVKEYLDRYVYEPKDWVAYLDLLGMDNVIDAARRGRSVYND